MRYIAIFVLAVNSFLLNGQSTEHQFAKAEAGIMAGFNYPWLQTTFVAHEHMAQEVLSVSEEQNPGISMALTVAYPFSSFFEARTALMYSRYDNRMKYLIRTDGTGTTTVIEQPSVSNLEIPLHFILSPSDYSFEPAIIAGPRYGFNLSKNAGRSSLNYTRHRLGFDVGAGATFAGRYFDVSPEVVFTFGLSPLATLGHGTIGGSIEEIHRNTLQLSVYIH